MWQIICRCVWTRNKYLQCGVPAQVHPVGSASASVFCLLPDSLLNTESHKWHVQRVVEDSELFRGLYQALCFSPSFFLTDFKQYTYVRKNEAFPQIQLSSRRSYTNVSDGIHQLILHHTSVTEYCLSYMFETVKCSEGLTAIRRFSLLILAGSSHKTSDEVLSTTYQQYPANMCLILVVIQIQMTKKGAHAWAPKYGTGIIYGPSASKAHTKREKNCFFHLQESRSCMNPSSLH